MTAMPPQPDPGALSIAPADGYQYGDDHPWTVAEQTELVGSLDILMTGLPDTAETPLPSSTFEDTE